MAQDPPLPDIPFHAIVEQSLAGIYILQDECFAYANSTWAALIGYTPAEIIGVHLSRAVPADFLPEVLRLYHLRLAGTPPSLRFVTRGLHRDGHTVYIEVHGSRMMFRGRPAVMGVGVDVTQQLRNEQELRASQEQLRDLAAHTTRKLEEQRQDIARDMHDVLGGMLTSIKMDASRVLKRTESDETRELVRGILGLTQETIDAVKRMSEALRPSALDHLDLSVAVRRDLQEFSQRHGIAHQVHSQEMSVRLSPRRALAVYRVFSEALTNVARHSQAGSIEVHLASIGDEVVLSMKDDGQGFDPASLPRPALGLLGMSERAREIEGSLRIDSTPGRGTRLELRAPLL
ncbi:UNVERIFIED_ORG: PAS domain S-box-containing protein [Variovorax paradoxus]|nr:PAS domain S-box-containing protein [Variovorax paradoxus]